MDHGIGVRLDRPSTQAVEAVTAALKDQGFGARSTRDVRSTPREKRGKTPGAGDPALDTLRGRGGRP
ncbi:hypothetical protein ATKI12_5226 [Kitasatospora sp. Ki12]